MKPSSVSHEEVRTLIARLLSEIGHVAPDLVTDAATIDGDLKMESVAFIEVQVAIEDEYDIELDPIHIVELNRFPAIVDYVYDAVVRRSA